MEHPKPKRLSWIAALLITVLLCASSVWIARRITATPSTILGRYTLLPCTAGQDIQILGDGVLYNDGSVLHALNSSGQQIWTHLAGTGSGFSVSDGGVAAWSGLTISLLDARNGSPLYSGSVVSTILSAKLGTTYAAVLMGEEHDSTMLILEHGGRQIDEIALPNQTVLDYGFFNNGTMLWVMSLDTEGTTPLCSISTYRPSSRMQTGTISDGDQVIYRVLFQSAQIRTVGTTYARSYNYTGAENESDRLLVYGWYLYDMGNSSNDPLMAFAPTTQVDTNVVIRDVRLISGATDRIIRMPFPCFSIAVKGNAVYGIHANYAMVCGLDDAKPTAYALPLAVDRLIGLTDSHAAVLTSGNEVYLVPLP